MRVEELNLALADIEAALLETAYMDEDDCSCEDGDDCDCDDKDDDDDDDGDDDEGDD
jgi:hypothetical protein